MSNAHLTSPLGEQYQINLQIELGKVRLGLLLVAALDRKAVNISHGKCAKHLRKTAHESALQV
jgi:hypothetical protein